MTSIRLRSYLAAVLTVAGGGTTTIAAPSPAQIAAMAPFYHGPPGPPGSAGQRFTHSQSIAAASWTVNHNLGFYPTVAVLTAGGAEIIAAVTHLSTNTVTISLNAAATGSAVFS